MKKFFQSTAVLAFILLLIITQASAAPVNEGQQQEDAATMDDSSDIPVISNEVLPQDWLADIYDQYYDASEIVSLASSNDVNVAARRPHVIPSPILPVPLFPPFPPFPPPPTFPPFPPFPPTNRRPW